MSRKYLVVLLLVAAVLLALYSLLSFETKQYVHLSSFLKDKDSYDGRKASLRGEVIWAEPGSFVLRADGQEVTVLYNGVVERPTFGATTVIGAYNRSGFVVASEVAQYEYNTLKYVVSLFSLAIVWYLFWKEWKFDISSMTFGDRDA